MCGGAERSQQGQQQPADTGSIYTPPDMKSVYQQFRDTGNIPYSYYGVGAPTREGELDLVRASYPGAFSTVSAQTPAQPQRRQRNINPMMAILGTAFSRMFGQRPQHGHPDRPASQTTPATPSPPVPDGMANLFAAMRRPAG